MAERARVYTPAMVAELWRCSERCNRRSNNPSLKRPDISVAPE